MSICTTINAGLNASPAATTAAVNTFLGIHNPISIVSVDAGYNGRTGQNLDIKLCYKDGGAQYLALLFQGNMTQTSADLANIFFAANPSARTPHVLDISNVYLRNLIKDAVLVLAVLDYSIDIQGNRYMAIVEPTAPVAAGATGTFRIIGSTGPLGSFLTAVNRDAAIWGPGEYGRAAVDPATGAWQAWSTCCP